jgi:hypothetical protein
MRSRELNSLRLQLEHLLNRVERANDDRNRTADELHSIGLALKHLIDFTLPASERADGG